MMIQQLSKANHFLKMLFGSDSSRKLEPVVLHKLDLSRMEVHSLVICLVVLAETFLLETRGLILPYLEENLQHMT